MTPIRVILDGQAPRHERRRRALEIAEAAGCRNVEYEAIRPFTGAGVRGKRRVSVWLRGDVPKVRHRLILRRTPEFVVYGPHPVKP